MVDDGGGAAVGADRQEFRAKLLAGADVDRDDLIGDPEFLQHDRDLPAVRRRRVMQVDHGSRDYASPGRPGGTFVVLYVEHKTWHGGTQSHQDHAIREAPMLFPTTIAGSLPKPEWLAEPNMLWAPWKAKGEELVRAKRDATLLVVKKIGRASC